MVYILLSLCLSGFDNSIHFLFHQIKQTLLFLFCPTQSSQTFRLAATVATPGVIGCNKLSRPRNATRTKKRRTVLSYTKQTLTFRLICESAWCCRFDHPLGMQDTSQARVYVLPHMLTSLAEVVTFGALPVGPQALQ